MLWFILNTHLGFTETPRWFEYSVHSPEIRWQLPVSPDGVQHSTETAAGIRWRTMKGKAHGFSFRVAVTDSAPLNKSLASVFKQLSGERSSRLLKSQDWKGTDSRRSIGGKLQISRLFQLGRNLVYISTRADSAALKDTERFLTSFSAPSLRAAMSPKTNVTTSNLHMRGSPRPPAAQTRQEKSPRIDHTREEQTRTQCRENMADISKAQLKYRAGNAQHHYAPLGNLTRYLNPIPCCPDGGNYTFKFWWKGNTKPQFAKEVPELRLTVQCGLDSHGSYTSSVDDDAQIPDYNRNFRAQCKENMRVLLRAQEIYKVRNEHQVYTLKMDDVRPFLKEVPTCPQQGNYAFTIGLGRRDVIYDCVIPNGAVIVCCDSYGHGMGTLDKRVGKWVLD